MIFTATIKANGELVVEVIKREDSNCSRIKRLTEAVGPEISDEPIAPDCGETLEGDSVG